MAIPWRIRSRNVLYNAAIVAELLREYDAAFHYIEEYLNVEGLGDSEQAEGEALLRTLRPQISVLEIRSSSTGARVFIDRLDLAEAGSTPLRIAVPQGELQVHLRLPSYRDFSGSVVASVGTVQRMDVELVPLPAEITFEVTGPQGTTLEVDGEPTTTMRLELEPGTHAATVIAPGRESVTRRFMVEPDAPTTVRRDHGECASRPSRTARFGAGECIFWTTCF